MTDPSAAAKRPPSPRSSAIQYQGTLLLASAYPQDPRMVGGLGVSDEIDELGDATKADARGGPRGTSRACPSADPRGPLRLAGASTDRTGRGRARRPHRRRLEPPQRARSTASGHDRRAPASRRAVHSCRGAPRIQRRRHSPDRRRLRRLARGGRRPARGRVARARAQRSPDYLLRRVALARRRGRPLRPARRRGAAAQGPRRWSSTVCPPRKSQAGRTA